MGFVGISAPVARSGGGLVLPARPSAAPAVAANVTPSAAPTSGAATPIDYSVFSPAQQAELQAAVDAGIHGAGASFTNPQLESSILAKLQASGLFTQDELAALQSAWSGAQGSNPMKESNKGGGNTSAFEASWFGTGVAAIQNFLQSAAAPSATTGTTSGSSDTSNEIGELLADLPALTSGAANSSNDTTGDGPAEPVYYGGATGSGASGGGSPILGILMVGAGAALGIWWYEKHHHKGA